MPSSKTPHTMAIDFSPTAQTPLQIPKLTDSLGTVNHKIKALADVIATGRSISVATGAIKPPPYNPVERAKKNMKPTELDDYNTWVNGLLRIPSFDWTTSREAIIGGEKSQRRYQRRADAMCIIWETNEIIPENAMWLAMHEPVINPLVLAVSKVETSKQEAAKAVGFSGCCSLSDAALRRAELGVLCEALDGIDQVVAETYMEVQRQAEEIARCAAVLEDLELVLMSGDV